VATAKGVSTSVTMAAWVGQYLVHTAEGPKYRYLYGKTRREVDEKR
jgi:hypothetical protein